MPGLNNEWLPGLQAELGYEGQHEAFALTLCETMATLGSQHLAAISKPGVLAGGWMACRCWTCVWPALPGRRGWCLQCSDGSLH